MRQLRFTQEFGNFSSFAQQTPSVQNISVLFYVMVMQFDLRRVDKSAKKQNVPEDYYKIIRMVRYLSLVYRCVQISICKHSWNITRIFNGYVLSDVRFNWLVEIWARITKIYFDQEVNKQHLPSFVEIFSRTILWKQKRTLLRVYIASSGHSGSRKNSRQLCKPSTASWVCITVSNSPNSPRT